MRTGARYGDSSLEAGSSDDKVATETRILGVNFLESLGTRELYGRIVELFAGNQAAFDPLALRPG
jgi:hypothetical protein